MVVNQYVIYESAKIASMTQSCCVGADTRKRRVIRYEVVNYRFFN